MDPQLWNACAGSMVQMPPIGSDVFYFPQGHAEHANANLDFSTKLPSMFLCRVSAIHYMADSDSDQVFAKIKLLPLPLCNNNGSSDDDVVNDKGVVDDQDKPASFAKTLTQSDANNGGGFSVPRYCAETIFPGLDYSADPPVQTILAKDVHGEIWKFRHIYRGTPRRHLLTTGWSNFVNHKKLVAGDSIVFLRAENGELCVGVRRAKRGSEPHFGGDGRKAESVVEAVSLAVSGKPFEIVYYPRACTPEFCVRASVVSQAMRIRWCCRMRFKMPFETEDSSRISWFMGTISAAQVADPVRWPNSPWRLLRVAWDEPDLLHNVNRVSPWLVELVSNMPPLTPPFSPPRKKLRFPEFPSVSPDFLRTNSPFPAACVQGARHGGGHFGLPSSDLHFSKLQSGLLLQQLPPGSLSRISNGDLSSYKCREDGSSRRSCLLTMGRNVPEKIKAPMFVLFGQPIHTEEQMSQSSSDETVGNGGSSEGDNQEMVANASNGFWSGNQHIMNSVSPWHKDRLMTELKLEATGGGHMFLGGNGEGLTR